MRVFITGAGMVGCHVARELIERGDEVTLYDLDPREDYVRQVASSEVRLVRGDLRELPTLLGEIQAARAEAVVHTGALIGTAAQQVPYRGFQTNIGGTLNVAEAVRLAGVRRLVHASTLGVHDLSQPQPAPLAEDFPAGGADRVYGASKVACEQVLRAYAFAYGFELAMLRLAGVYGYGLFAGGSGIGQAMFELAKAAQEGRQAQVGSGLPEQTEIVYVKDAARGFGLAVHAERLPHQVYNVGSGTLVTLESILEALRRSFPNASAARAAAARSDPFPRLQPFDLSRSKAELGYEPRYDLEAGLRDSAQTIQERAGRHS